MAGKFVPKVILEGTRLTCKTEIALALNEHPRVVGPRRQREHSPLISAQWASFGDATGSRSLIDYEPEEAEAALEVYHTWLRLFQFLRYHSWIVDRFHISTRAYQQQAHGTECDFRWLEEGLAALNFRLVFCWRSPASFPLARAWRLPPDRPQPLPDSQALVAEQELMRRLSRQSILPLLELDVSDNDVLHAADTIADWLAETRGLYPGE